MEFYYYLFGGFILLILVILLITNKLNKAILKKGLDIKINSAEVELAENPEIEEETRKLAQEIKNKEIDIEEDLRAYVRQGFDKF